MGISVSVFDVERSEGKRYLPPDRLVPYPAERLVAPGNMSLCYQAMPKSRAMPDSPNMFWWVDIQFLPYSDNELVTSIGAYLARPGRCCIPLKPNLRGLLYTFSLDQQTDRHENIKIIRGSSTSSMPNVTCHPSGRHICFAGVGCTQLMNLHNLQSIMRNKDVRNNQFRNCAVSPNGLLVATIAKCSFRVELGMELIERAFFVSQGVIECHKLCPGFNASRNYTDQLECRFSPDSSYVAAGSSMGYLFVASRSLQLYCSVVPGMFDRDETRLANERTFDFDPRYDHTKLALGSDDNKLVICDLDKGEAELQIVIPMEGSIQCLKYSHSGHVLAVGTSEAVVNIYDPDSLEVLYTLDAKGQDSRSSMKPNADGNFPEIIRMSFTTTGEQLAVSATDGYVRVWQMHTSLSLQHLCRLVILQNVPTSRLQTLPLPQKVIKYLLQLPAKLYYV